MYKNAWNNWNLVGDPKDFVDDHIGQYRCCLHVRNKIPWTTTPDPYTFTSKAHTLEPTSTISGAHEPPEAPLEAHALLTISRPVWHAVRLTTDMDFGTPGALVSKKTHKCVGLPIWFGD